MPWNIKIKALAAGLLLVFVGVLMFCLFGQSQAHSGRPWPQRAIRVQDSSGWSKSTQLAIQQWNRSGAKVLFQQTDHSPDVRIIYAPRACRKPCAGKVSWIGYRGQTETIFLAARPSRLQAASADYGQTRVIVHELGHILGLQHRPGCSIMSQDADKDCQDLWFEWTPVCGPLSEDIQQAQRLYGSWPQTKIVRKDKTCLSPDDVMPRQVVLHSRPRGFR